VSRVEVKLPHPVRGGAGRFSGVKDAFRTAAEDVLKKFALYDDQNGAELMAHLFKTTNFGYGPRENKGRDPRKDQGVSWSKAHTGGSDVGDSYGAGPRPTTGAV
jgi:hypothetical protein